MSAKSTELQARACTGVGIVALIVGAIVCGPWSYWTLLFLVCLLGRSRVVIGMAVHADFSAVHGHGAGCSSIAFAGLWRVGSHVLDRKRL